MVFELLGVNLKLLLPIYQFLLLRLTVQTLKDYLLLFLVLIVLRYLDFIVFDLVKTHHIVQLLYFLVEDALYIVDLLPIGGEFLLITLSRISG